MLQSICHRPNPKIAECSGKAFSNPRPHLTIFHILHNLKSLKIREFSDGSKKKCSYKRARAGKSGVPKTKICRVRIPPDTLKPPSTDVRYQQLSKMPLA
ncbi:hypothetical protein PDIG_82770 [Penicillium digitatum PHI26]|uniref:Uncharacterized protein n=2 Tax=Penicillium digitatum TaxID=36651 RepID=K9FS12_PEND2|nr:hypothetical protein PDIP_86560 [Penicillium digitatum Pd1]EKV04568.1 hypothetical protein PDIP_86560 [Penicillium digitatum Pd1]EKV05533.1 hypothetical protein PDIG_82770 [Penicillium digitatum PHI26]